jgi:hypothetical protein
VEVPADGAVAADENLLLQVTPNADGYLRIQPSEGSEMEDRALHGMQRIDIPLPKFSKRERLELQILFSRHPFESRQSAGAGLAKAANAASNGMADPVRITITLTVQ